MAPHGHPWAFVSMKPHGVLQRGFATHTLLEPRHVFFRQGSNVRVNIRSKSVRIDLICWFSVTEIFVWQGSCNQMTQITFRKRVDTVDLSLLLFAHVVLNFPYMIYGRVIEGGRIRSKSLILCHACSRLRLTCVY